MSALTSPAMLLAMATGAVLSAPLLMTPCGSSVPTVTMTVSIDFGTSCLNSIQLRSSISRVDGGFCATATVVREQRSATAMAELRMARTLLRRAHQDVEIVLLELPDLAVEVIVAERQSRPQREAEVRQRPRRQRLQD